MRGAELVEKPRPPLTKRIVGRLTAAQSAAASTASVFPRLTARLDAGGRHQPHLVPESCQLPRPVMHPVMRPCAGVHADEAGPDREKTTRTCARRN